MDVINKGGDLSITGQKTHQVFKEIYRCGLHLQYKSNLWLTSSPLYMNVTHPGWLLKQYNLQFPSTATANMEGVHAILRQLVNFKLA